MLLMSGLLYSVHQFVYAGIYLSLPDNLKLALDYVHAAVLVLLPVIGWVAESWLGRYRAIAVGLVFSSVTILAVQVVFIMLQFDRTLIPAFVLIVVGLVMGTVGCGSFYSIMLPYALDQMIWNASLSTGCCFRYLEDTCLYCGTAKTVVLYSTHGTHSNRHERCCLTRIETSAKFHGIRLQITKNTPNLYIAICQPFCKHGTNSHSTWE